MAVPLPNNPDRPEDPNNPRIPEGGMRVFPYEEPSRRTRVRVPRLRRLAPKHGEEATGDGRERLGYGIPPPNGMKISGG